jgi:SpoVK/Ycf46/Vps4 family AAA+-type ATPase
MITKPVVSGEVDRQMMNAVVMYQKKIVWKQWGLGRLRRQGTAILLVGPPGTGKTTIAEYLALKVRRKGIKELSFADFGSHIPGENARQIRKVYKDAKENGEMTVFLDDCEAILWDRSRAGSTAMWMLEVIDELLVQIGKYTGFQILATNKPELLDPALERRLLSTIVVDVPAILERYRLWQQKIPADYPLKLSIAEYEKLAGDFVVTGAEIENIIIEVSADALRQDKKPTLPMLRQIAMETAERRFKRSQIATLQSPTVEGQR